MLRSTAASTGQQARKQGEQGAFENESIVSLAGDPEILPPVQARLLPTAPARLFACFRPS
jgi:hypothetical protein